MLSLLPREGGTLELSEWWYKFTLDAATHFLFGESVNSLDNPKVHPYLRHSIDCCGLRLMRCRLCLRRLFKLSKRFSFWFIAWARCGDFIDRNDYLTHSKFSIRSSSHLSRERYLKLTKISMRKNEPDRSSISLIPCPNLQTIRKFLEISWLTRYWRAEIRLPRHWHGYFMSYLIILKFTRNFERKS